MARSHSSRPPRQARRLVGSSLRPRHVPYTTTCSTPSKNRCEGAPPFSTWPPEILLRRSVVRFFRREEAVGRFLLIRGRILLKDYAFLGALIENHHSLTEAVNALSLGAQQRQGTITKKEARTFGKQSNQSFSRESAKQIKKVPEWLHGSAWFCRFDRRGI